MSTNETKETDKKVVFGVVIKKYHPFKLSAKVYGGIFLIVLVVVLVWWFFFRPVYQPPAPNTKLTYAQLVSMVNNLEQENRYKDALTLLNSQAVQNNTNPPNKNGDINLMNVLSLKAGVYIHLKDYSQAISVFEQINSNYGENPSIDDTIANLALKEGDKNTAKTYFNKELTLLEKDTSLPGVKNQISNIKGELASIK